MLDIAIRNFRPSDGDAMPQFFQTVFTAIRARYDPETKDADLRNIPREYQTPGGEFFLAIYNERLVGTAGIRSLGDETCELKRFYVLPDFQRQGIGSCLLTTAIAHATAGTWRRLRLDTSSKSPVAISLFLRHGFVYIARYNEDPFAE